MDKMWVKYELKRGKKVFNIIVIWLDLIIVFLVICIVKVC